MNLLIFLLVFLVVSVVWILFLRDEYKIRLHSVVLAGTSLVISWLVFLPHLFNSESYLNSWWFLDSFSAIMALLATFVYAAAITVSFRYVKHEYEERLITVSDVRLYFVLFHLFVLCMLVTVLSNNVLLLWIALEGTTLSSAFLVGFYRRKTSMEAAWKYVVICTTGISLGLIGILLMSYGSRIGGLQHQEIFTLSSLMMNAALINAEMVKWAFVFLIVGFGVKVGLAPMHTWLPDAHSKAPSPISAIFSGVLLNVALYAILRFKFITDATLNDSAWTNELLLFFGMLSVILAAFMMLIQRNYKRMLAYSSIEHMGIISIALALPPIGILAAVIHMIGHTLTKSMLFFGAGEILISRKTTAIEKIRGLLTENRYTAILFLLGILAIIAIPPSILFISEYLLLIEFVIKYPKISILFLSTLGIIAYCMLKLTMTMLYSDDNVDREKRETWNITHTIMTAQMIIAIGLAFWFTTEQGMAMVATIANQIVYISK